MKSLVVTLCIALAAHAHGQRYSLRRAAPALALSFTAGAAWGTHEVLMHRYPDFKAVFPGANDQWWNPKISWQNKHTNDVPVWFTDAKHTLATYNQAALFGAGVCIAIGQKRPLRHYLIDAGLSLGAYSLGNLLTYDVVFRRWRG
jgi:hypothetical protein